MRFAVSLLSEAARFLVKQSAEAPDVGGSDAGSSDAGGSDASPCLAGFKNNELCRLDSIEGLIGDRGVS